jgi:hypothetical protein
MTFTFWWTHWVSYESGIQIMYWTQSNMLCKKIAVNANDNIKKWKLIQSGNLSGQVKRFFAAATEGPWL